MQDKVINEVEVLAEAPKKFKKKSKYVKNEFSNFSLELVSKELNQLVAILHVYAGGLNFIFGI